MKILLCIAWLLVVGSIHFYGWWRTRNNPRRHGFLMLNMAPPGEPPIWCDTVTYRRFSDEDLNREKLT